MVDKADHQVTRRWEWKSTYSDLRPGKSCRKTTNHLDLDCEREGRGEASEANEDD